MALPPWGAYVWEQRPGGAAKWSPLQQLGRTSLFIYWIHVEMVYGLISLPLHKALSWTQSWIALVIFCVFMLVCSMLKDRCVAKWTNHRPTASRDVEGFPEARASRTRVAVILAHRHHRIDASGAPGR